MSASAASFTTASRDLYFGSDGTSNQMTAAEIHFVRFYNAELSTDNIRRLYCTAASNTAGVCEANRNYDFAKADLASMLAPKPLKVSGTAGTWSSTNGVTLASDTKYK